MKNLKTNMWSFAIAKLQAKTRISLLILVFAVIGFSFVGCSEPKDDSPPATNSVPVDTTPGSSVLTGTVSILGFAAVGEKLEVDTFSLDGSGDISYQWKRGGTVIGTESNYTVQTADVGSTITVTVKRTGYSGSITSAPTAVVVAELPPTPGLSYMLIGNYYSVSRGTATATDVVIPSLYEGLPVTTIGDFSGYREMRNIKIGGRVTTIGQSSFSNCSGLEIVNIPDSVMTIGGNAFYNCTSLEIVTIPDSVTRIDNGVFTNCSKLTKITIPYIGPTLSGTSIFGYLFGTSSYDAQNASIPSSLKTVIVTGGTSVTAYAFYGCSNLTSITLPNSVQSIGQNAFYGCSGLTDVTLPNNSAFTTIGSSSDSSGVFQSCTSLASIIIPDSVQIIGNNTFYGCSSLTEIIIPSKVNSIGQSAFYGCSSLTEIIIPNSVNSIGNSVFRNCTSLKSITMPRVFVAQITGSTKSHFGYIFDVYDVSGNIYTGYIPESLKTVIITGGDTIPSNAFENCNNLTSITIPDSVQVIGLRAFYNCSRLTSVTIPDGVGYINDFTFYGCSSLTEIIIPNNVNSIGQSAFYGCSSLTEIIIPNNVNSIGQSAFYDCSGLMSVTIPNGVTSIKQNTFYGCSSLTSITIPNDVQSIGDSAFKNCRGLTSVNFNATAMSDLSISSEVFGSAGQDAAGITVTIGANVTKIPGSLFYSSWNPKITAVNFASGSVCQSIGGSAFRDCTELTSITIPDSVTSIGYAFSGCTGLTSVTFQGTIPSNGFYINAFIGDLQTKFYATNSTNGTPGTYTTTAPVNSSSVWTKS